MLSWVVRVVPKPPEPPPKKAEEQKEKPAAAPPAIEKRVTFKEESKAEAAKPDKPKQEGQVAEENRSASTSQPAVLTWISGALPQPVVSPKPSRSSASDPEENATTSKPEDEKGMMAWIAQSLEKVVPQPDLKSKETPDLLAEGRQTPSAPEPQVTVVEVESDQEDNDNRPLPPRMIDWIKHGIEKVVPQPEIYVRGKTTEKIEAKAPPTYPPPAPMAAADTEKSSKEADQQPNMMGWIVSGIGRMMPQPVQKHDSGGDDVLNRGKCSKSPLK